MNLKLITTEQFNNLDCNFYRNTNDDILLTREQIGTALEYSNPSNAIALIHKRHSDRLDNLSACVKLTTPSGVQNTFVYTERGVMEICRWSNSDQANLFMDFVWEVMDRLIKGEPVNDNSVIHTLLQQNQSILQNQLILQNLQAQLQAQQDNQNMYQTQAQQQIATLTALITAQLPQPYKPRYTRWMGKTYDKINKLAEYNSITRKQMLRKLYTEFQDTYDIDLGEYQEEYCAQHNLQDNGMYTLNAIDSDYKLKELFDLMLDTQIEQTELKLKEVV